ncbi:two-component system regulatory protein YycI [Gracilibacillus sp. D59]|uniref:two-component system regulatory protein YycI n=1 Tax=Gracilibacillus sp. D59 TaxID=3457434 RepID=UPI003FCD7BF6
MQWDQIKTLFILCFLVLDIFLLHHFINNSNSGYEYTEEVPIEENVRNNVNGLDNLPEEYPTEEAVLNAERREFSESEVTEIGELPNQKSIIVDNHLIISKFDLPLAINVEENTEALGEHIWNFDQYQYFGKDEKSNTFIFFQKLDRPIYFNLSGVLLVQVNEKDEVTRYVQTILEKADEQPESDPEEINSPFNALTGLYLQDGFIGSDDEITDEVTLGYHNLLPLPNGVQVLAPTWEFEVNDEKYYYVNAIESHLTSRNTNEFIRDMKKQINDYYTQSGTAAFEITNKEEWDEKDLNLFIEQLLENQKETGETNGVE